jgi:hypothetical protein
MDIHFIINISLQGPEGQITYGRFCLGNDRSSADEIFQRLKGSTKEVAGCYLKIELLEEIMGLPVPSGLISCTLDDLKENIAIISKEVFRIANLENKDIGQLI